MSLAMLLVATMPQARCRPRGVHARGAPPPPIGPLATPPFDLFLSGPWREGVSGAIANSMSSFDPAAQDYPGSIPPNFDARNEGFAGVITVSPRTNQTLTLYCIDILTNTYVGIEYNLGTWDAATVPRVGFVTRILMSTTRIPLNLRT